MMDFIKGLELCKSFFSDCAKPILSRHFPEIKYSAGLLGYGSDVLGYDDRVSTDHMWGPRFYLFLEEKDLVLKDQILSALSEELPYTYKGYSVNFSSPDFSDNGVRRPVFIQKGRVDPLVWIMSFDEYLTEQLGVCDFSVLTAFDWLTFSEHRLLSLKKAHFFVDDLLCAQRLACLDYYPENVKHYLIASNWDIIASEQAFVKRCSDVGDEPGSVIICARIAERLMRLCFLYRNTYAPYSKWLGKAFSELKIDTDLKRAINTALRASKPEERENMIVLAQMLTAKLHNECGITDNVDVRVQNYFGRSAKVIFAESFSEAVKGKLQGTELEKMPLMGSLSQLGGLGALYDEPSMREKLVILYKTLAGVDSQNEA